MIIDTQRILHFRLNVTPTCRTLQVMVASALVCWLVWNLLCVRRMSGCILDYFGRLESLDRCCTWKHMLLESQQLELVASLMTLVCFFDLTIALRILIWWQLFVANVAFAAEFMQRWVIRNYQYWVLYEYIITIKAIGLSHQVSVDIWHDAFMFHFVDAKRHLSLVIIMALFYILF